jgi:hypothetical protein
MTIHDTKKHNYRLWHTLWHKIHITLLVRYRGLAQKWHRCRQHSSPALGLAIPQTLTTTNITTNTHKIELVRYRGLAIRVQMHTRELERDNSERRGLAIRETTTWTTHKREWERERKRVTEGKKKERENQGEKSSDSMQRSCVRWRRDKERPQSGLNRSDYSQPTEQSCKCMWWMAYPMTKKWETPTWNSSSSHLGRSLLLIVLHCLLKFTAEQLLKMPLDGCSDRYKRSIRKP